MITRPEYNKITTRITLVTYVSHDNFQFRQPSEDIHALNIFKLPGRQV